MRRFKKQKEPSYWGIMDGSEKFMVVFVISTLGFLIYTVKNNKFYV